MPLPIPSKRACSRWDAAGCLFMLASEILVNPVHISVNNSCETLRYLFFDWWVVLVWGAD